MYRYMYMNTNVYIYVYSYDNSFDTAMKVGQLRTKEAAFTHRKILFQHRHTVILCGIF